MLNGKRHRPLFYVGLDELGDRAHVMVDGSARPGTALVLSHWPGSSTPREMWADLSTEIAFRYLKGPRATSASVVTCDHLDEDGLASLAVLYAPDAALANEQLLVGLASAGDFGVVIDERSAALAFAVHALVDPARSPYATAGVDTSSGRNFWTAHCYSHLLADLFGLIEELDGRSGLYEHELSAYLASKEAFSGGEISIEEDPDLDLAIVRAERPGEIGTIGQRMGVPYHPYALHSATSMARIVVAVAGRICYYDRYETWVRFVSRRRAQRRDMAPFAAALTAREKDSIIWSAGSPNSIEPSCSPPGGVTTLSQETIVSELREYLADAPAAFDPFA